MPLTLYVVDTDGEDSEDIAYVIVHTLIVEWGAIGTWFWGTKYGFLKGKGYLCHSPQNLAEAA